MTETVSPSVQDIMSRAPVVIDARASADHARSVAEDERVHHLLVVDDGELVGVVCLCDLGWALPVDAVGGVMRSPVVTVAPGDSIAQAARTMTECGVGCLPVIGEDGVLSGVVTRSDLRAAGALRGEPGVDRCAACGDSHHLKPPDCPDSPVLCFACRKETHRSGVRRVRWMVTARFVK